jgi:hypothetical protein
MRPDGLAGKFWAEAVEKTLGLLGLGSTRPRNVTPTNNNPALDVLPIIALESLNIATICSLIFS